jgi:hypothetical protein
MSLPRYVSRKCFNQLVLNGLSYLMYLIALYNSVNWNKLETFMYIDVFNNILAYLTLIFEIHQVTLNSVKKPKFVKLPNRK